jgi:hypothetical protein
MTGGITATNEPNMPAPGDLVPCPPRPAWEDANLTAAGLLGLADIADLESRPDVTPSDPGPAIRGCGHTSPEIAPAACRADDPTNEAIADDRSTASAAVEPRRASVHGAGESGRISGRNKRSSASREDIPAGPATDDPSARRPVSTGLPGTRLPGFGPELIAILERIRSGVSATTAPRGD